MKVKPCPICGIGKPRMVHFAPPLKIFPDNWEETEDCLFEPIVTSKYIECDNCGARTMYPYVSIDNAIDEWNYTRNYTNGKVERIGVMQYITDEYLEVDDDA